MTLSASALLVLRYAKDHASGIGSDIQGVDLPDEEILRACAELKAAGFISEYCKSGGGVDGVTLTDAAL